MLGALYLDQGYQAVHDLLEKILFPKFAYIQQHQLHRDFKSMFQELVQAQGQPTPNYTVLEETGPDHDKIFTVAVLVDGLQIAQGVGPSKQKAETEAAKAALEKLEEKW